MIMDKFLSGLYGKDDVIVKLATVRVAKLVLWTLADTRHAYHIIQMFHGYL